MERTIDYQGKKVQGTEVRFDTVREEWNIYELKDGTTLRIKIAVTGIVRINGEYDPQGDPIYVWRSQNLSTVIEAPEHLRKK